MPVTEALPLVGIGQGGLLCLVVWMILTDRLVPGRRLDALQVQLDRKDETIKTRDAQIDLLLSSAIPTVNSVLTALHQATEDAP